MTSVELLQTLQENGVSLAIQGDRLKVDAPAGALTLELREAVAAHKTSLMTLMSQRHSEANQLPLVADATTTELDTLRAERDRLAARWAKGADYLDAMEARGESETAEFARLFAEWERVNSAYMQAADVVSALEGRAQHAEWIQKQPAPKERKDEVTR